MKYNDIKLQTPQGKGSILSLEYNIRGGISSVRDDRYVTSDENKKMLYADLNKLYGHFLNQPLPYDEVEMWHGHPDLYVNKLEEILTNPEYSDI